MPEENKENPTVKNNPVINDLLMKPFSLGWTREVVKRLITNSKTPNCDIYYLSPNKKRLRSLTEVKCNLTDGLSPECFSFKRAPLGLSPDLETIRDAKARGKGVEKSKEKNRTSSVTRKQVKSENAEVKDEDNENEAKNKVTETEIKDLKPDPKVVENGEKLDLNNSTENTEVKNESKKKAETKSETKPEMKRRRAKSTVKQSDETKTFNSRKKTKTKSAKPAKSVKLQSVKKRKNVLKKVMNAKKAKQAKLVASRKVLKKIVNKNVASLKCKLTKKKVDNKAALKTKNKKSLKLKATKKPLKNSLKKPKKEIAKEPETNETDKKSATKDLKSIVKKNIVKYREMREKQKLGAVKAQGRSSVNKIPVAKVSRSRLEPISKNRHVYIKPLEKGWRRELVFRSNCAKAGQQADVYYFHPSGKKLRSFREVSENLTHGLSIECFTFRKEAIGCGEPSEVVRNARSNQKS